MAARSRLVSSAVVALALAGCVPVQPPAISLRKAMVESVDAIVAQQAETIKLKLTAYQPCDITSTFAITTTEGGSLGLTAASVPILNFGANTSKSDSNTVVTDWKSQACIDMTAHQMTTQVK